SVRERQSLTLLPYATLFRSYFYADPAILLGELSPQDSILLVPHRHPPEWEHWVLDVGEYNTGFVAFRNDVRALDALRWWKERCLDRKSTRLNSSHQLISHAV